MRTSPGDNKTTKYLRQVRRSVKHLNTLAKHQDAKAANFHYRIVRSLVDRLIHEAKHLRTELKKGGDPDQ